MVYVKATPNRQWCSRKLPVVGTPLETTESRQDTARKSSCSPVTSRGPRPWWQLLRLTWPQGIVRQRGSAQGTGLARVGAARLWAALSCPTTGSVQPGGPWGSGTTRSESPPLPDPQRSQREDGGQRTEDRGQPGSGHLGHGGMGLTRSQAALTRPLSNPCTLLGSEDLGCPPSLKAIGSEATAPQAWACPWHTVGAQ